MGKRNYKSLLAAVLAAVMMFGTAADVFAGNELQTTAAVQEADDLTLGTGLLAAEFKEINPDEFTGNRYDAKELAKSAGTSGTSSLLKASQIYSDDWDQYSTNYYYNLMTDAQKELWDALDVICLSYLNNKTNMTYYREVAGYGTDFVYTSELSAEDAGWVALIFHYSNPQYYYLQTTVYYATTSKGETEIAFGVYRAFANGTTRASATKKFQSTIQSWTAQVSGYSTDYEKVKAIHDLICANVKYNYGILNFDGTVNENMEETAMSQSAYSTFVMGTTVCAGYAQACELLCNAVGIDAIVVTSADHGWNKVRMEDSWYNVDCTWDDQDDESVRIYTFFARSDNAYDNQLSNSSSHQEESYWIGYLPSCTLDSGSTAKAAGKISATTEQTQPVTISPTPVYTTNQSTGVQSVKSYKVTMTCATEGASIYYTTDGSTPSVASGKAKKYEKAISVTDVTSLRAIAVCDQKLDSEVVVGESSPLPTYYTITYVLNGGTISEENPTSYTSSDAAIKLKSPTKKGYTFAGWYTSKSFDTSKVKTIATGSAGDLTLYAKWTPITYKITFKGNGATSGSMSAKSCKYGTSYKLTANKFKRKGYTFAGWNTKKNGTGKTYKNKASIKNLTSTSGKTITLYAQWKKKK